jgi:hypothetical protein
MIKKNQRHITLILLLNFVFQTALAQTQPTRLQSTTQLALSYYNAKDFEKAAPLLYEVYELSKNNYYFRLYLTSLIELQRFEEAEAQIKKEIKKLRSPSPELQIHWGYLLKTQGNKKEAEQKYTEALNMTSTDRPTIMMVANAFTQWQEFEWTKKVYLKARRENSEEHFSYELALAYMYLRDYEQMMEEYLNLIAHDEKQLQRVESALSSAMRIDVDNSLRTSFRTQVLKRIQAEPNVIGYNRLLIWFFLQEKQFAGALRQSIALDKRTGEEDMQIYQLGQMALNNSVFNEAERAFNYLVEKGEKAPLFIPANEQKIHAAYLRFKNENNQSREEAEKLADMFEKGLETLGYIAATLNLIGDYAHLLAFYLDDSEKAISVLQKGLEIPRLRPEQSGMLKTEMADIYIYAGDPWEATLLYSQVIESNKNNLLGDEVKLKKAMLGYYMGNFGWAKAQLDVLKASTSKFTANDAMELSMLIGNNLNLDTTAVPLQMFARADLLFFRNKEARAMATLDSIAEIYPYHSLMENILLRKAKIEIEQNRYELAAEYLQEITENHSYGLLADKALFMLAELNNYNLGEKEKAKELYRLMLTRYPGSVFVEESREKFRELRETYPDIITNPQEELFLDETVPDEIN